jgi:DNA-binding MarR family transcriptional regulator
MFLESKYPHARNSEGFVTASSRPPAAASAPAGREALADQVLDLVPRLRRRFEQALPPELREELSTVTLHQLEALRHLCRDGGMTMAELAQVQCIGLSSATALADRLLRQGLAQRTAEPGDRRVVRLVPTDAALQLVERFATAKRRTAVKALDALSDAEAAELLTLLAKIAGDTPPG